MTNKILAGLLGLLGFSSCEGIFISPDMYGPPPAPEYGVPYAEFTLRGSVSDEAQKKPVENIQVVLKPYKEHNYMNDTVYTDKDGKYLFNPQDAFGWEKIQIIAEDIDGEENGGSFAPKTEQLDMADVDFTNGDNWYLGSGEATVDFTLEPAGEPENDE